MKKTYIEPQMKCIAFKASKFLCGSLKGDGLQMGISSTGADSEGDAREYEFDDDEY